MRKLFKKSIACCLALALCLTLFAGAISANALTTNPSYSTEAVTVKPGESATIKFTVSDFSEIQGVILKVYVPAVVASIDAVTANGITLVEWDDEEGAGNYQIGSDATGKYVKFMELANFEGVDAVAAFTFDIAVTVAADAAIGDAAYPAPVIQATDGNALVTIDGTFAAFTVEEAVVACQHTNVEFYYDDDHEFVAAQGDANGETAKGVAYFQCADCGEIIEEEISYYHYYTTGTQNAVLESEILFNFKAQPKHLERQGAYEDVYFVLDMQKETGRVRKVTNIADADYDDSDASKPYYVVSMGVAGKEMTTTMTSTVFVKYNGKWWSGLVYNKKLTDYTTSRAAAASETEKALYANMLTYGAACQVNFNFNLEDMATDYLGVYADYVTETTPVIADTSVNELVNTAAANRNHVGYHSSALDLGSVISMKLGFRTDFYKGTEPLGNLVAVATYTGKDGNPVVQEFADGDYVLQTGRTDRYEFLYNGIAAKDMRKKVTFTFKNDNGALGYYLEMSIEDVARKLIDANSSNTKLVAAIEAMMMYGDAANAYFNS